MNRSERGALVAWAVLLAVVVGIVLHGWFIPAHGFRPVPGVVYPDLCRNGGAYAMPGRQSVALFLPVARVRFVNPDEVPTRKGRRQCVTVERTR